MPLEDLTGNKYIDDLNENWPLGTDYPSDGDNHFRGLKNVLKKSFPNITGPVTLTQDQLNQGSIPAGTVMMFYQASAPDGWTRVQNIASDYMIRIVETTDEASGGTASGTDDPILNNKAPAHTHAVAGSTGSQNANHAHTGNTGVDSPDHSHSVPGTLGVGNLTVAQGANHRAYGTAYSGGATARHSHAFTTSGNNASHQHYFSATSGNPNSGVTGNWTPRYMNAILCSRD